MAKGKGRERRLEARWRRISREHGRSGLGARDFCRQCNLRGSSFCFWRSELHRREVRHPGLPEPIRLVLQR